MAKVNYLMQQTPFKVEFLKSNAILKQDNWKNMSMNILRREFICILHLFFFFSFFFFHLFLYTGFLVVQLLSCVQLFCNPMNCSPPGSCPRDFPSKNIRVGSHFLFQKIFPTQGSNLRLLYQILYHIKLLTGIRFLDYQTHLVFSFLYKLQR